MSERVRCTKCGRIIRAEVRLDYGDGSGRHIVCPATPIKRWPKGF